VGLTIGPGAPVKTDFKQYSVAQYPAAMPYDVAVSFKRMRKKFKHSGSLAEYSKLLCEPECIKIIKYLYIDLCMPQKTVREILYSRKGTMIRIWGHYLKKFESYRDKVKNKYECFCYFHKPNSPIVRINTDTWFRQFIHEKFVDMKNVQRVTLGNLFNRIKWRNRSNFSYFFSGRIGLPESIFKDFMKVLKLSASDYINKHVVFNDIEMILLLAQQSLRQVPNAVNEILMIYANMYENQIIAVIKDRPDIYAAIEGFEGWESYRDNLNILRHMVYKFSVKPDIKEFVKLLLKELETKNIVFKNPPILYKLSVVGGKTLTKIVPFEFGVLDDN